MDPTRHVCRDCMLTSLALVFRSSTRSFEDGLEVVTQHMLTAMVLRLAAMALYLEVRIRPFQRGYLNPIDILHRGR